jgi:hypothetical protein
MCCANADRGTVNKRDAPPKYNNRNTRYFRAPIFSIIVIACLSIDLKFVMFNINISRQPSLLKRILRNRPLPKWQGAGESQRIASTLFFQIKDMHKCCQISNGEFYLF